MLIRSLPVARSYIRLCLTLAQAGGDGSTPRHHYRRTRGIFTSLTLHPLPFTLVILFNLLIVACGGGGGGGVVVTIITLPATVPIDSSLALTASVTGCSDCTVNWSVVGGIANGTVSPAGPNTATTYTAPLTVPPPPSTITVRATSNEVPATSDTVTITVADAFGAAQEFGLGGGQNPQALVIGQFNHDNNANLGIAVANKDTNNVTVFIGNGNGTLQTPPSTVSTTTNSNPVSIATGFFDADTLFDLATANNATNDAAILLGNGDGSFAAASPATAPADIAPQSVAVGDYDGINGDDLAVANFNGDGTDGNVTILLSNGDGTFTVGQTITLTASNPIAIAAGFIDGNTNLDLVVTDLTGDIVWVILGNGDGTFQTTGISPIAIALPFGTGPAAVAIGDFNGDTFADLAVVNVGVVDDSCSVFQSANANKVTILLGDGLGTFGAPTTYPVGSNPRAIAVGDFNKNGIVDLVTANYCSHDVSVLFGIGDGTGTFQAAVNYDADPSGTPGSQLPTGVAVGDLDNNGFDDIAVSNAGTDSVSVLLNSN